jgi:hypothetical protein
MKKTSSLLIENAETVTRKNYNAPRLTVYGDVESITLGIDIGENLDAAFTISAPGKGRKKPKKKDMFS